MQRMALAAAAVILILLNNKKISNKIISKRDREQLQVH
jgi:hypothetical protein